MGMPITIVIEDAPASAEAMAAVFRHFTRVDETYSTYKPNSEISRINAGLPETDWGAEMKTVLGLCEQTRQDTNEPAAIFK